MKNWEIYLIDFPFTDGAWSKKRPCVIIWIDKEDIEVLFITTKILENTFLIKNIDFEKGWLKIDSYIRLNKGILFHKKLFLKHSYIWTLKIEVLYNIYKQILINYSKLNFDTKTINCIEKCINS